MKSSHTKGGLLALVLFAALGAAPPAAAAQQGRQGFTVVDASRGWLGIRFGLEVRGTQAPGEPEVTMVIHDVQNGSPAHRAGVARGDTVVRIDGRPVTTEVLETVLADLEAGQRIRLTLQRAGRTVRADVVAAARPAAVTPPQPVVVAPSMSVRIDSITSAIVAQMDSARVSVERGRVILRDASGDRVAYVRPDTIRGAYVFQGPSVRYEGRAPSIHGDSLHVSGVLVPHVAYGADPTRTVPLEVFLFQSQEADSLRRQMARVQRELQRVSEAERRRVRELAEEMARTREREIDQRDALLRELREQEARLEVEMARTRQEMERAREMARQEQAERTRDVRERMQRMAEESRRVAEVRADFRPLSLYAAGQNMVAGARLTDLNPALAEYFEVEGGVLVTEVLEGTPAAEGGLLGGDVIVRVGDTPVDDLSDLRAVLMRRAAESSLTVVRKGRRVTVTLPRE